MEANQSKAKVGQVCFDRLIENELDMQPFSYAYECNFVFRQNVKQNIFNISRSFIFQSLRETLKQIALLYSVMDSVLENKLNFIVLLSNWLVNVPNIISL